MLNIKTKVIVFLVGCSVVLGSAFWIQSLRHSNEKLETEISQIQKDYVSLNNSYKALLKQRDSENAVLADTRKKMNSLEEELNNSLTLIKKNGRKESGDKQNEKSPTKQNSPTRTPSPLLVNDPSDALDGELIGLLDTLCSRVRGSPCPAP